MQFPMVFHIGSLTLLAHPIFEFLAFAFGYWYYKYLKRRSASQVPLPEHMEWAAISGMIVGAFIGSRLIAALEDPTLFLHPVSWLYYVGSQTIAGAVIGGIVGVEISKKIFGVKRRTGDFFVFPLMLGIMIGRVGCFLTGVTDGTVGLPSNLPWAFDQGDGIPRHPTSAYEIAFLIIAFFVLRIVGRHTARLRLREGDLFRVFVIAYGTFRFFIEFIKPVHPILIGLSSIQIVCGAAVLYYIATFILRKSLKHDNA